MLPSVALDVKKMKKWFYISISYKFDDFCYSNFYYVIWKEFFL